MPESVDANILTKLYHDLGDSPEAIRTMIDLYLVESMKLMERIHQGLDRHELHSVEMAAHSLKSSSGALGATPVSALARELEAASHAGAEADTVRTFDQIAAIYPDVRRALGNWSP